MTLDSASRLSFASYANEYAVATAGTAVGADTAFDETIDFLSVVADKDIFFAKTQAAATEAADGGVGDRVFAVAGERRIIPWRDDGFWVVNAVAGELPAVRVEGWR